MLLWIVMFFSTAAQLGVSKRTVGRWTSSTHANASKFIASDEYELDRQKQK